MFDSAGSGLLLIASGALLLRPSDFPRFARIAGRIAGASVHSLRAMRHTLDKTIQEGRSVAGVERGDLSKMRDDLSESLSKFDKVTSSFRRDLASVPLSPRDLLRKGFQSAMDKPVQTDKAKRTTNGFNRAAAESVLQPITSRPGQHSDDNNSSGADFIARVIEEEALARQQQRIFSPPNRSETSTN